MQPQLIHEIVREVRSSLIGRFLGKIFQLTPLSFALDLGYRGGFLFISVDPSSPRFYLIQRRVRDLEKQASQLSHFGQLIRARLGGGQLISVEKDPADRVVWLTFRIEDDLGASHFRRLVIQLTGRSSNLFILDELNRITSALRNPVGAGQQLGQIYHSPLHQERERLAELLVIPDSPSAAADAYFAALDATKTFNVQANALLSKLRKALNQKRKLRINLQKDLADHGEPLEHKRRGDLLLANLQIAVREGSIVRIVDYYADGAPEIEIEVDENRSLEDEAARQFLQYTKAKRAREEIAGRLVHLEREISQLEKREQDLEIIISSRDANALANFDDNAPGRQSSRIKPDTSGTLPGVRRYLSTDGYEVLVGRAARDNDNLTFRLARPNDLWLHAGDYPGSHVIIRNPNKKEIPQRTVIEAAQLAGRFSQASEDSKVVVHYTERKFLSKPKGAAAGLVRMARFRSITVEPKESIGRL
jgi:predicted ribosome quality control (RQC) complex YloA/Tae2 family protein